MKKVTLLLFAVFSVALQAQAATFGGLGDLPAGDFYSVADAVSADGQVVVGKSSIELCHDPCDPCEVFECNEAFRWTDAEGMVGLGHLIGYNSSHAISVSSNGQVIAGYNLGPDIEAFRWTEPNGMVGLGYLPGSYPVSSAYGISDDGQVIVGTVGSNSGSHSDVLAAFRWTEAEGMVGLGFLPGGGDSESYATSCSFDGQVIVGGSDSENGYEAFRWTEPNGMVGLGGLSNGYFLSEATAVSADGQVIVGGSLSEFIQDPCDPCNLEAFRWTEAEGMIGLGFLLGDYDSYAWDVTANGKRIVGQSGEYNDSRAFIWDPNNGMRDLKDVLQTDFGLDLTGWELIRAYGISENGSTIVGSGRNPSGNTEAWVATVCWDELAGDFNNDCMRDISDLAVLSNQWLDSMDFSNLLDLANAWLDCGLDPPEVCW
jgi:probable HAF family extracellular repeat protein